MATVLLVDDDGGLRQLVRARLADHPTLRLVADLPDVGSAVAVSAQHRPALVVLRLSHGTSQAMVERLRAAFPSAQVMSIGHIRPSATRTAGGGDGGPTRDASAATTMIRAIERALGSTGTRSATCDFADDVTASVAGRQFVRAALLEWDCEPLLDDALLIVSELVNNAVTHAASPGTLTLRLGPDWLCLEVRDRADAHPHARPVDLERSGGRGMMIVGAVSDLWGVTPLKTGKCVWAVLSCPGS